MRTGGQHRTGCGLRLGIPDLKMQDAAQGFRATQPNTGGTTTAFPCAKLRAAVMSVGFVSLQGITVTFFLGGHRRKKSVAIFGGMRIQTSAAILR